MITIHRIREYAKDFNVFDGFLSWHEPGEYQPKERAEIAQLARDAGDKAERAGLLGCAADLREHATRWAECQ